MKTMGGFHRKLFIFMALFPALLPAISRAAGTMNDYCVTPPFISAGITPNLLLMIDNSSSMYDLAYVDKGTATRQPVYCYDQTYSSANTYSGYFDSTKFYEYNFTNDYFTEIAAFPGSCTSKYVAGTLCIQGANIGTSTQPKTITKFAAKGNYLNWLTASKFDVEKQILTGGKYNDTSKLFLAESRGCIGRRFVKEALTANYVEGGTNTSLAITFGVRGPSDPADPTRPSAGGQTYIDIFDGNYNQAACDDAVDDITAGDLGGAKASVKTCLAYPSGASQETKEGVVFNQSLQACLALNAGTPISTDDVNTVVKQCTDVYAYYGNDPAAIPLSSPSYLCNSTYVGKCYDKTFPGTDSCLSDDSETGLIKTQGGAWDKDILKGSGVVCGKACVIDRHEAFCGQVKTPPVTDPTEDPANATNVPAILSDMGVLAQLDLPLFTGKGTCSVSGAACVSDAGCPASPPQKCVSNGLAVRIYNTTAPTGLVQEFSSVIRSGAMAFNYNASQTEKTMGYCSGNTALTCTPANASTACGGAGSCVFPVPSPKVCSGNTTLQCMSDKECSIAAAGTCTTDDTSNKDGAKIIHYIGKGTCSVATSTECATNAHCPTGEKCLSEVVDMTSHATGLVKAIDDVKAATWTSFAEAFYNAIGYFAKKSDDTTGKKSRIDLRLNGASPYEDFKEEMNPSQYRCQANNILLISDGMSTADRNTDVNSLAALYNDGDGEITGSSTAATACPGNLGSKNLDDFAWLAKNRKISAFSKTTASTTAPADKRDYIRTYVVNTGAANNATDECNPALLMQRTATNGGGTYWAATDPPALKSALRQALVQISAAASSGTAASILSNSEGSGANILQAVFYPKKTFDGGDTNVSWIGELQNLWYYIDPFIGKSTVRADSDYTEADLLPTPDNPHYLDLTKDLVAQFTFNVATQETEVILQKDANGDGAADAPQPSGYPSTVSVDAVKSIWRAGRLLWARPAAERTIYTQTGGSLTSFTGLDVSDATGTANRTLLQAGSKDEADKIISFTKGVGEDLLTGVRPRIVAIKDPDPATTYTSHVWKLGDIISSTPRVESGVPLNGYHQAPSSGYNDKSYDAFINTTDYKDRGMAYVAANDGMLHAFKMGKLDVTTSGERKAKLSGDNLGKEEWAFIPKNALPYLKYLTDPLYTHLYTMDGSSILLDASIGCSDASYWTCAKTTESWRTVLIGSMGLGGASANKSDTGCTEGVAGTCVKTPVEGVGYSSYFALDVTNQASPTFLWEFPNKDVASHAPALGKLGFATTGPATVRVGDKDKTGSWFAVFASGPTGPITGASSCEFKGNSNQNLLIFVVDLKTGKLEHTIDTGITEAFAGSISSGTIDTDRWNKGLTGGFYQDDAVYIGYVKKSGGAWNDGGVLRLQTKDSTNVGSWTVRKVIDGIGPVTTAIGKLQDRKNHNLWLYFGTGRYFFNQDDMATSNPPRRLFGVKEPCYNHEGYLDDLKPECTDTVASSVLTDKTTSLTDTLDTGKDKGWYRDLEGKDIPVDGFGAERVISDPVAMANGVVFFTSFKPTDDLCEYGGKSFMWAVKYDSGGLPLCSSIEAKALVQVSTGAFIEMDLQDLIGCRLPNGTIQAPKDPDPPGPDHPGTGQPGGKPPVTEARGGTPPREPPPIITKSNLHPVKKILHIRER